MEAWGFHYDRRILFDHPDRPRVRGRLPRVARDHGEAGARELRLGGENRDPGGKQIMPVRKYKPAKRRTAWAI
jgi:hypothetical protein